MYQQGLAIKTLLNSAAATEAAAGSAVDLLGTFDPAWFNSKVIVAANGCTGSPAASISFALGLTECDTTDGSFTAVGGDSITAVSTNGVSEYHVKPTKRYIKAAITTVSTQSTQANLVVLLQVGKREA